MQGSEDIGAGVALEGLSHGALEALLESGGVNPAHAGVLFRAVQRRLLGAGVGEAADLPPPLRRWLSGRGAPGALGAVCERETASGDGYTRKYLLRLPGDGALVEVVRMGFAGRHTACLSSQVGCAMGCVFCATGRMGFSRDLRAGEIVAQAHHVERALRAERGESVRNVVMMGMGEPLANFEASMEALDILTDTRGLNLGPARVALSTVGHIPGILRLARHPKRYSLVVSLHGADGAERRALVPADRKWPLEDLLAACREYSAIKRAKVFFAWTLIGGVNDGAAQARRLAELLRGMDAHVNLIPLNATEDYEGSAPRVERVRAFHGILREAGLPSTVRQRRGIDVAAGCGQLKTARPRRAAGRAAV